MKKLLSLLAVVVFFTTTVIAKEVTLLMDWFPQGLSLIHI